MRTSTLKYVDDSLLPNRGVKGAHHVQEPLDIDCCAIDPDILRLAYEQRDQPKDEVTSVSGTKSWRRSDFHR